jgi:glutathione reductase (NADPH)
MADFDYDLFVIGAGSGGVRAARIAASHGARVAVAEEHRVGGTCVIRGCVPKKLLVYGSHFAEDLHDAKRFGWNTQGATFDWNVLRDNVAAEVNRLEGLYGQTLGNNKVEVFRERAGVTGPNSVQLSGGRNITAANILIATGAWPSVPEIPGAGHGITSNEVFSLPELPKRLPPVLSLAFCCWASSTKFCMAVTRRGLAKGPMVMPASMPLPTLSFSACSTNWSTNSLKTPS